VTEYRQAAVNSLKNAVPRRHAAAAGLLLAMRGAMVVCTAFLCADTSSEMVVDTNSNDCDYGPSLQQKKAAVHK
jgi:hypothetical protein